MAHATPISLGFANLGIAAKIGKDFRTYTEKDPKVEEAGGEEEHLYGDYTIFWIGLATCRLGGFGDY